MLVGIEHIKGSLHNNKLFLWLMATKYYIANHLISTIPFYNLRHTFYRHIMGMQIGKESSISMNCFVTGNPTRTSIIIGDNSVINRKCYLDGRNGILIGNNVNISPDVYILTLQHDPNSPEFACIGGQVIVEDDAWIGVRAIVLPNVKIGRGAVIGAGAVVTKNIPPYSIAVGVPAVSKKMRSQDLKYKTKWFPYYDTDISS